jgi:hypothetical protein
VGNVTNGFDPPTPRATIAAQVGNVTNGFTPPGRRRGVP